MWLPTGFGIISMCYQALPFVMDYKLGRIGTSMSSVVVVVSPSNSLISGSSGIFEEQGVILQSLLQEVIWSSLI